jgi:hypothetical protein
VPAGSPHQVVILRARVCVCRCVRVCVRACVLYQSYPAAGVGFHPMHAHDCVCLRIHPMHANIPFLFQVTNLSPSIAISMNYVDSSNIDKALEVTRLEGLVDPDSFDVNNKLAAVKDTRFVSFCFQQAPVLSLSSISNLLAPPSASLHLSLCVLV